MGYKVAARESRWEARKGLEGPFYYANGRVLYYDAREGQYWDPTTDFYVPNDEIVALQQQIIDAMKR